MLEHYAADLPRLLQEASDKEKRQMARCFVEKVELDPGSREIDIRFRLPGNCADDVEAAARTAVIGTIVAQHARARPRCVGGRGRRAAAVIGTASR